MKNFWILFIQPNKQFVVQWFHDSLSFLIFFCFLSKRCFLHTHTKAHMCTHFHCHSYTHRHSLSLSFSLRIAHWLQRKYNWSCWRIQIKLKAKREKTALIRNWPSSLGFIFHSPWLTVFHPSFLTFMGPCLLQLNTWEFKCGFNFISLLLENYTRRSRSSISSSSSNISSSSSSLRNRSRSIKKNLDTLQRKLKSNSSTTSCCLQN